ncbi:MAG TPA: S8 family serine peptidase, partial [Terriglobales bacterium]|nr:S8 family serine peptidase [Terriglobales bacterium]
MRGRIAILIAVLTAGALAAPAQTLAPPAQSPSFRAPSGPKYAPDRLLVKFRAKSTPSAMAAAHAAAGATVAQTYRAVPNLQLVQLPAGVSVAEALQQYRSNPAVQYAEPDYIVHALETVPNDPSFSQLWAMKNTGQTGGTPGADIKATLAWSLSTGSSNLVVAVIDTGADYTHPDLSANIWSAPFPFSADGVNCSAGSHGFNALADTCDPMDDANPSHGTHVSGTIGAVGNNNLGVAGVNWHVTILPCKFLGANGSGPTSAAVACLDLVASLKDQGVNIVATNNSWGGGGFSQALYDAIQAQMDRGILFVAAAGNDSNNNDLLPDFPSGIDLPNVIAVAATDASDALASFSNFGRYTVHLGAPGVSIFSTLRGNAYGLLSGTSMAAPHVTGSVALLQAQNPALDWKATRNLLLAGGDVKPAVTNTISQRRLNLYGSMTCVPGPDRTLLERLQPVLSPTTAGVGDPFTLSVLNIDCAAPAGPLAVTVDPGGSSVPLQDDGDEPDLAAGDGTYAGAWTPPSPGAYTLTFPNSDVLTVLALRGYSYEPVPFSYVTFAGTNLNLSDDSVAAVNLPFSVRFGGQSFSTLYVSSNGTISVERAFQSPSNAPLPTRAAGTLIAPFWYDLMPQPGTAQNVFWTTQGTAPNRQVIIEWRNVPRYGNPVNLGENITFEVVLNEGADDVLFSYQQTFFDGPLLVANTGGLATSGIQVGPNSATQYSYDQQVLFPGLALLWRTLPDFIMQLSSKSTATVFAGNTTTFQGTLTAEAGYNSSVSLSCVPGSTGAPATCSAPSVTPSKTGAPFAFTVGDTTAAEYDFSLQGAGSDANAMTHTLPVTLQVIDIALTPPSPSTVSAVHGSTTQNMTFQVSAVGNFGGNVTFSCSGLPAGAGCSFSPDFVNLAPGVTATVYFFSISTQVDTPPGTYTVHVVATASTRDAGTQARTQDLTLNVLPDFQMASTADLRGAKPGEVKSGTVNLTADPTYSGTVNLSCSVLFASNPAPQCSLHPASVNTFPSSTTLTVTINGAPAGSYTVRVTGTDGTRTHTVDVPYSIDGYRLVLPNPIYAVSGSNTFSASYLPLGNFGSYGVVNAACNASAIDPSATCSFTDPLQPDIEHMVPVSLTVPPNVTLGTFPLSATSSDTTGTFSSNSNSQVIVQDFTLTHGPNVEALAIRGFSSDPLDGEIIPTPGSTLYVLVNCTPLPLAPGPAYCSMPPINLYPTTQGTVIFPVYVKTDVTTPVGDYVFGLRGALSPLSGPATPATKSATNIFVVHVRDFSISASP